VAVIDQGAKGNPVEFAIGSNVDQGGLSQCFAERIEDQSVQGLAGGTELGFHVFFGREAQLSGSCLDLLAQLLDGPINRFCWANVKEARGYVISVEDEGEVMWLIPAGHLSGRLKVIKANSYELNEGGPRRNRPSDLIRINFVRIA